MGRFAGPGYVRFGPATAGCFGVGCLVPILMAVTVPLIYIIRRNR